VKVRQIKRRLLWALDPRPIEPVRFMHLSEDDRGWYTEVVTPERVREMFTGEIGECRGFVFVIDDIGAR
jgi:hypothetical protein